MAIKDILIDKFSKYKFSLNDEQLIKFEKYFELLVEWNEKFNLTTILGEEDVVQKHFLDSILPIKFFKDNSKVLDIGAGAGFPSLPLKIMNESLDITMIDSVNKKVVFLNEVAQILQLKNTRAIHARAEDFAKGVNRENFDYVVSRAVASLDTLVEYCLPFVKIGGYFVAYKSEKTEEEVKNSLSALSKLGGKIEKIEEINLFGTTRKLVYIKKIAHTPPAYPRGKNKPRLNPLR